MTIGLIEANIGNHECVDKGIELTHQLCTLHVELLPHDGTADAGIKGLIVYL